MPLRLIVRESAGYIEALTQQPRDSVARPATEPVQLAWPLEPHESEDLRWYLEDYLVAPYAVWEDRGAGIAAQLASWGEGLFTALFPRGSAAGDAYRRVRASWEADPAEPLELQLASQSPEFLSMPWELLKDPTQPAPLALDAGVTRTVGPYSTGVRVQGGTRLRVLMVIARPGGTQDVRYRIVARPLLERLATISGDVRLEVLRPPTFDALKLRLEAARREGEPYQVVHFDGHGVLDSVATATRSGALVFETGRGGPDRVSVAELAPVLGGGQVPLLVFNACHSGTVQPRARLEATVATGLVEGGAPAVVAMGYAVYAVAAAEFMAAFYAALFGGCTVSRAMTAGRCQLFRQNHRPSPKGLLPLADWMVPVHYARCEVTFPELGRHALRAKVVPVPTPCAGAADETATPGSVAPEGAVFVGRDAEFYELERALSERHVVLLHGLAGTGKTELAKGFARWLQESGGLDDAAHVFFHSCEPGISRLGLDGAIASAGLRLLGSQFAGLGSVERRSAVLEVMRRKRLLLVWDNFETVHSMPDRGQDTAPLGKEQRIAMRSFLDAVATSARGGIVVTSRSPEAWLGDAPRRIEVGGLDGLGALEYAEVLLSSRPEAALRRSEPAYGRLLELLAGHPLSMRLVLPLLATATAHDLVNSLEGLAGSRRAGAGARCTGLLEACVQSSFQHLAREQRKRLPALALFEGVADVDVLAAISRLEEAPSRFRGADETEWAKTLEACAAVGLLTAIGRGLYRLHPALPAFLGGLWRAEAGALFDEEHEAGRIARIHAHATVAAWLLDQIRIGRPDVAMRVLAHEYHTLGSVVAEALERHLVSEAQAILQPLCAFWDMRGRHDEVRSWIERCQTILRRPGDEAPEVDTPEGALWLFLAGSQANLDRLAGNLIAAESGHASIACALETSRGHSNQLRLAVAYHHLGLVAQDRGELDVARTWYRKSLRISEALDSKSEVASTYHQLGWIAHHRGDHDEAEAHYRRCLDLAEAAADQRLIASALHQLGWLSQDKHDLENAQARFLRALQIRERIGDRPRTAMSYHQLGLLAELRGELDAAQAWYLRCLEICEALQDRPGMAPTYYQLGMVAQRRGDVTVAEAWYGKALAIAEATDDRMGTSRVCHQVGMLAQTRGDLDAAEAWYLRSKETQEVLGDQPGIASSYHQLATVAQLRGDLNGAEELYRRSLQITEALKSLPAMARSYHHLGITAQLRGELLAAEGWFRKSLAIKEKLGNRPETSSSYYHLGMVAHARGDLEGAAALYQKSLDVANSVGDRPTMAVAYAQMGLLAYQRGRPTDALDCAVRSVSLFPQCPHPGTGTGPQDMIRLTALLGVRALEESWLRCTGRPLPKTIRDFAVRQ